MRRRLHSSVLAALALTLIPLSAQAPTSGAPQATAQPVAMSQPGAKGVAESTITPAVPVPPGPVPASSIKPAPPTPIATKKAELGDDETWDPQWDVEIEEHLPPELLTAKMAHAVRPFCPRFGSLNEADKRAFWAYLFQALAGAEAGLKPTSDVRHMDPQVAVRDTVTHRTVRQEGLLQLTYMDSDRYSCDFDWDADKGLPVHDPDKTILQPKNNLLCGIRIMKNQLINLHEPLLTPRSYWATLRPGTLSYSVFARQMANVPEACGAHPSRLLHHTEPAVRETAAVQPVAAPAANVGSDR